MPSVVAARQKIIDLLVDFGFSIGIRAECHRRFVLGAQDYGELGFMRREDDTACWSCHNDITCLDKLQARFCPFCGAPIGDYGYCQRRREELLDAVLYTIFGILNGETTRDAPETVAVMLGLRDLLDLDDGKPALVAALPRPAPAGVMAVAFVGKEAV